MKIPGLALLLLALLAGCVTAEKLNQVRIGMTKDQVIAILGQPDSTSAQANIEYLTYYLSTDTGYYREIPYSVRLVDGKVESFGRFTQLVDIYNRPIGGGPPQYTIGVPVTAPAADITTQLLRLKALKDQGVLTDEEFQKAKERLLATK